MYLVLFAKTANQGRGLEAGDNFARVSLQFVSEKKTGSK